MKKHSAIMLSILFLVLSFTAFASPAFAAGTDSVPTDAETANILQEMAKSLPVEGGGKLDIQKTLSALGDQKNIALLQKTVKALTDAAAKVAKGEEVKDVNSGDPEVDKFVKTLASKENIEALKSHLGKLNEAVEKAQESLNSKEIKKEGKDPSDFFRAIGGEHRETLLASFTADMGDLFGHFGNVQNEKDMERASGNFLMKIAAYYIPQVTAFEYKIEQEPGFFNEDATVGLNFKVKMGPRLQHLLGVFGVGYDVVTDAK